MREPCLRYGTTGARELAVSGQMRVRIGGIRRPLAEPLRKKLLHAA